MAPSQGSLFLPYRSNPGKAEIGTYSHADDYKLQFTSHMWFLLYKQV